VVPVERGSGLIVDVRARVGGVDLEVRGELDVATLPTIQRCFDDAVAGGAGDVLLDLTGVTFLDARGVGFLATAVHREVPVRMRVSARVRRLLEITDLASHLPLID
jgi:anti-sigma B factor antagonist